MSLEFLLISLIGLFILISISLPLTDIGIESIKTTSDSIEIKSEMVKITNFIDDVYSDGIGSKRTIDVKLPRDTNIIFYKDSNLNKGIAIGSFDINNQSKSIEIQYNALNINGRLNIQKKTITRIVIEWNMDTDNIIIRSSSL